jgi:hypothetical protein
VTTHNLLLLGICGVYSPASPGCCAYTARGKATAAPPPSSVMNSRRFMQPAQLN